MDTYTISILIGILAFAILFFIIIKVASSGELRIKILNCFEGLLKFKKEPEASEEPISRTEITTGDVGGDVVGHDKVIYQDRDEEKPPPPELRLYLSPRQGGKVKELAVIPKPVLNDEQDIMFNVVFVNHSTTPAKGISIQLYFWWDGDEPETALKIQRQRLPEGWEINDEKIHNSSPASMVFRSIDFIAYYEDPIVWRNITLTSQLHLEGQIQVSYKAQSFNPQSLYEDKEQLYIKLIYDD